MPPRRPDEDLDGLEEEELDVGSHDAGPAPSDRTDRPLDEPHRAMAPFAVGALLLVASLGLLIAGFTQDYYEVDVRLGPQPDGDTDTSDRLVVLIGLQDALRLAYDDGTGDPDRENVGWDDYPITGILMTRLTWTAFVGVGLLGLALLGGLLHRFGALTVSGPAPMMALLGLVTLGAGLIPFVVDIAHHARVEMIPLRLDFPTAFWTSNADGDVVHDLYMRPLAGFWLHASGVGTAAVGSVLLFWSQISAFGRSLGRFAESAEPRLE